MFVPFVPQDLYAEILTNKLMVLGSVTCERVHEGKAFKNRIYLLYGLYYLRSYVFLLLQYLHFYFSVTF